MSATDAEPSATVTAPSASSLKTKSNRSPPPEGPSVKLSLQSRRRQLIRRGGQIKEPTQFELYNPRRRLTVCPFQPDLILDNRGTLNVAKCRRRNSRRSCQSGFAQSDRIATKSVAQRCKPEPLFADTAWQFVETSWRGERLGRSRRTPLDERATSRDRPIRQRDDWLIRWQLHRAVAIDGMNTTTHPRVGRLRSGHRRNRLAGHHTHRDSNPDRGYPQVVLAWRRYLKNQQLR